MQPLGRNILAFAAWGFVAATLIQVFLAGLGVFRVPENFELHRNFGYALELVVLILFVMAILVRASRMQVGLAALTFGLFLLQSVFVNLRATSPEVAALHPVNGFLIVFTSIVFARQAWRLAGRTDR